MSFRKSFSILVYLLLFILNAVGQAKEILPSEPEVLADLLFSDPSFEDYFFAPGGGYMALTSRAADDYRLVVIDLKTRESRFVEIDSGQYILYTFWVDSNTLLYATGKWGVYVASIYAIHVDRKKTIELYRDNNYFVPLRSVPSEEDTVVVLKWDRLNEKEEIYSLNTTRRSDSMLYEVVGNPGNMSHWMLDASGSVRIGVYDTGLWEASKLKYRSDNKAKWRDIVLPNDVIPLKLVGDGSKLLVSARLEGEDHALHIYDLENEKFLGEILKISGISLTGDAFEFIEDSNTQSLVGFKVHKERPVISYIDPVYTDLQRSLQRALPGKIIDIIGYNTENLEVFFRTESDTDPGGLFLLDMKAGAISPILDSYPDLTKHELAKMTPVSFPARDGTTIHGYLTMPTGQGENKPPLITIVHGGPWYRDTWGYSSEVQFFAAMGYAVLQVNYRGSSGYSNDYSDVPYAKIMEYSVTDVADGCRWLVEQGKVDGSKIAIFGSSYGGYAAVASAAREPDLYKCAVGFAGVYDWVAMKKSDQRDRGMPKWFKDVYDVSDEALSQNSPARMATSIKCPILLLHGKEDKRVDYRQSRIMQSALKAAKVPYEAEAFSMVGHGFRNEKSRIMYYMRVAAFLREYLGK